MDHKRFYKELGKLLYAVAASDGKIQNQEVDRIRKLVREELAPAEGSRDQFGTDNAYYAEFEFETLADQGFPSADAYHSFLGYLKEYESKIDPDMKALSLRAAQQVASAVGGVQAVEFSILSDLKKHLS